MDAFFKQMEKDVSGQINVNVNITGSEDAVKNANITAKGQARSGKRYKVNVAKGAAG